MTHVENTFGIRGGIFDRDGTLATSSSAAVEQPVKAAVEGLELRGVNTTKGELRVSQDGIKWTLPLIVEAGSTIVDRDEVIYFPLSSDERAEVGNAIQTHAEVIKLAAFYPKDNPTRDKRAFLYTNSPEKARRYLRALSQIIRGITIDPNEFAQWLQQFNTGMIEFALDESRIDPSTNIMVPGINYSVTDSSFLVTKQGVTKRTGVEEVFGRKEIDSQTMAVAGDQPIDVPMFAIPGITSIAVGNAELPAMFHINSPAELPALLQKLQQGNPENQ